MPTRGRGKKGESLHSKTHVTKQGSKPFSGKKHLYLGATYLLESFANEIGLTHDLQICFPVIYKQILSIAFYLILEDNNPLYRFEKWHLTHKHPYGSDIASPRSSELFSSITDEQVGHFFGLQARRRIDEEYWAYDSTSISSYSETLSQIQYGKNKENDCLPQLNLLLVFGEKSGLPFYYRKLAGNIPDVITVKHLFGSLHKIIYTLSMFGKQRFACFLSAVTRRHRQDVERHGWRFTSVHKVLLNKIPRGTGGKVFRASAFSASRKPIPQRGLSRVSRNTLDRPPRRLNKKIFIITVHSF